MSVDLGHGRGWLAPGPAASVHRLDAQLRRPLQISDAGRSTEREWYLWNLYFDAAGKPRPSTARPAWLGRPGYPGTSPHGRGEAIDTNEHRDELSRLVSNGWRRTVMPSEPWHFVYFPQYDQHINDLVNPTPDTLKEHSMFIAVVNGNWHLVIPQGDTKPRAALLGGESRAADSGVPVFYFTDPNAVLGIQTAVEGIFA